MYCTIPSQLFYTSIVGEINPSARFKIDMYLVCCQYFIFMRTKIIKYVFTIADHRLFPYN